VVSLGLYTPCVGAHESLVLKEYNILIFNQLAVDTGVRTCVRTGSGRTMDAMAEVTVLTAATVLAAAAALALAWACLHGAIRLMQPAARPAKPQLELVQGTRAVMRGFALHR
jgi:hypothetical protein